MKGKYKKKTTKRMREQASVREARLKEELAATKQAAQKAEEEAERARGLIDEIVGLKATLDEICLDEQQLLEQDIHLLTARREELRNESVEAKRAHDPDSTLISALVFGPGHAHFKGMSVDGAEQFLLEVERRMAERYPDLPVPPEELFITSGIANTNKLGVAGVKAIQKARGIRK